MATEQEIKDLLKSGKATPEALQAAMGATAANNVTVNDWAVCYSAGSAELTSYCTVTANNPGGDPITAIGIIVYSGNGATMYAVQYTNEISAPTLMTSVATGLYTPSLGNQAHCIVYGWTAGSSYFFSQNMTIGSC